MPRRRRSRGMPSHRLLGVMAGAFVLAAILTFTLGRDLDVAKEAASSPQALTPLEGDTEGPDLRSYAVALPELQGLSPDTEPGSAIELWVAWDTPRGKKPRLEPLIERAVLKRIVPPLTPGAPDTALLQVPVTDIPDLLLADRYGLVSATVLPA